MTENLFKLTDSKGQTHGDTQWGEGVTHEIPKSERGTELCGPGVLHAYRNANLGLLLNPIHANYNPCRMFAAEGEVVDSDYGKVGCHKLTTTAEIPLPDWFCDETSVHRVRVLFAVLCAEVVLALFENRYPNDDRPRKAIEAAREYLKNPTAAYAADAAAYAAYAGARAARAAAEAASLLFSADICRKYIEIDED